LTKHIVFTGGSGKAGKHVIQYLVDRSHQVLNLDTKPLPPGAPLKRDIGEVESLLSNRKTRGVLGFRQEHSWRDYVKAV
jgi:nucleoside-diphosphate-sugar epimerase